MRIIDADGHVAEGASLAIEAMQRWPDHVAPRADGRALVIEGRNYPEDGQGIRRRVVTADDVTALCACVSGRT